MDDLKTNTVTIKVDGRSITRPSYKPTPDDAEAFVRDLFGKTLDPAIFGFLTGSVAFGEATDASDIDLAFPIMAKNVLCATVAANNIPAQPSEYNEGVKVYSVMPDRVLVFNLLFLHPLDYVVWFRAGSAYKALPRLSCREARHAQFESLRAIVKVSFALAGVRVTRDNYAEHLYN